VEKELCVSCDGGANTGRIVVVVAYRAIYVSFDVHLRSAAALMVYFHLLVKAADKRVKLRYALVLVP